MLDLPALAERFAAAARALYPDERTERRVRSAAPRRIRRRCDQRRVRPREDRQEDAATTSRSAIIARALEDRRRARDGRRRHRRRRVHQPAARAGVLAAHDRDRSCAKVRIYGRGAPQNERISLEFGSANPTGPLVVVQGRTLSIGDTLAKTLRFAGYDVFTEWIINDAGSQMDTLARSLYARYMQLWDPAFPFPDDGYPGDYLVPIAETSARDRRRTLAQRAGSRVAAVLRELRTRRHRAEQQAVARAFRRRRSTSGRARRRCTTRARSRPASSACATSGSPTTRTARSGCARPRAATTKTASSCAPTGGRPISPTTSPTITTSCSAPIA